MAGSSFPFPNGQTLVSSAQTIQSLETLLQSVIAQVLGYDLSDPDQATAAWIAVRVAWQQYGQPAWGINDDVCVVRATPQQTDPYSSVRDRTAESLNPAAQVQTMSYTQVWDLHFSVYGPKSFGRSCAIVSAMALDWVHDLMAQSNLYVVPEWKQPVYAPEAFQGQWWQRADVDLRMNELVIQTMVADTAAGVDVTLLTDVGQTQHFVIKKPSA